MSFSFYDEFERWEDLEDADRDSRLLRDWHLELWSKELPSGQRIDWHPEAGTTCLTHESDLGSFRVSSDTILTTHEGRVRKLWAELGEDAETYALKFRTAYTIGAFIVFPRHTNSVNQVRGTSSQIMDRFDLTLECIRRHYVGDGVSPLSAVLAEDAEFFDLFGQQQQGFDDYMRFFHLQDLVDGRSVRWLDGSTGGWDFGRPALPTTLAGYRTYLDMLLEFVDLRNARIHAWTRTQEMP